MIYTLCYRMTGNPTDAEDLMQEILTKLFLGIDKFEGRSAFSSWLYRVAHNHCLNFLTSRKKEYARIKELPESDMLLDATTERSPQDEKTQAVLASMAPEDRSLLILRYVMDLDVKQISEILHIGQSATKMRLSRVRDSFKKMFREEHGSR